MRKTFGTSAAPLTEAEKALTDWGAEFTRRADGMIVVHGNVMAGSKGMTRLPDLSGVIVEGTFWCDNNKLASLEGAPAVVRGNFYCYDNQLTTLKGAPKEIGEGFYCSNNRLESLEGAPVTVNGSFFCHSNNLASLRHAPLFVSGDFHCHNNKLPSLEDAPRAFRRLLSDFGEYRALAEIPEDVRYLPETRERMAREREEKLVRQATTLDRRIPVGKPVRFRKP